MGAENTLDRNKGNKRSLDEGGEAGERCRGGIEQDGDESDLIR